MLCAKAYKAKKLPVVAVGNGAFIFLKN